MKFFGLFGIYRTGSWIQSGQKLTIFKKMNKILQNPSKSCDFERISQFCPILCDFDRILPVFGTLLGI
jgi:ribosomal protein S3AE